MMLKFNINRLFTFFLFAIPSIVAAQCSDTIKLTPCEEMMKNKDNHFFQFSMIYKGDTLIVPKVGKDLYLNPVKLYGLDSLDFVKRRNDTIQNITLLFETTKFIYIAKIYTPFFTYSDDFCIKKGLKNKERWEYAFYQRGADFTTIHKTKRVKK